MQKISLNFSREEFACKCECGFDVVDVELIQLLERIRTHFGDKPMTISSGARCKTHNKNEGGGVASQHLLGKAADIYIEGVRPFYVSNWVSKCFPKRYGIGKYDSFTHVDVRSTPTRWDFTVR